MIKLYFSRIVLTTFVLLFIVSANAQVMRTATTTTLGLITHNIGSEDDGYVLFTPMLNSDTTYLIDKCGKVAHTWPAQYHAAYDVYLLPDGSILRPGSYPNATFAEVGSDGGIIERYDWDGNLVWHYIISDSSQIQNHDIYPMPNGNILVAVWEAISDSEAIANGRNPATVTSKGIWTAKVMEIQPIGTDSAAVVWQWRVWDHLVQDFNPSKLNYGVVADHPELLNLNYINLAANDSATNPDWLHLNQVTYNPTLDQVMISFHNNSEIYILDHSTTTVTAATHTGGVHNKGGDFMYRWGNPAAYNMSGSQRFFQQHDPTWIPTGKYANQIMIFNNGNGRSLTPLSNYSSVDIINPPMDLSGNYTFTAGVPYGPDTLSWSYFSNASFYSPYLGGAQTLDNGNVLICNAIKGQLFEIDSMKNIVWKYQNPINNGIALSQGLVPDSADVYRCTFYPASYSAFAVHPVAPGTRQLEMNPVSYSCTLGVTTLMPPDKGIIEVFPNPANTSVTIRSSDLVSATLYDITGRIITNAYFAHAVTGEINTSSLPDGVYILCVNGQQYKRIVIQH